MTYLQPIRSFNPLDVRAGAACLLAVLLSLSGCEAVSFVAQGFGPDRGKAVYPIANRPTLVLVDDPNNVLVDRTLPGVMADRIAMDLKSEQVVNTFIPLSRVQDLETELGAAFGRIPVDQLGRSVGAEQVIHIQVESMDLSSSPGIFQPRAVVLVKLIDTVESRRLFPPAQAGEVERGGQPAPSGYAVVSELFHSQADASQTGRPIMVARQLADRIGRDVARVFHDYPRRLRGSGFDD